jgi:hypothetical protein
MPAKPGKPTIRVIDGLKLGDGKKAWNPCSTRAGHLDHHCDLRLVVVAWRVLLSSSTIWRIRCLGNRC